MNRTIRTLAAFAVLFAATTLGCSNEGRSGTSQGERGHEGGEHGGEHNEEGRGEHDREGREHDRDGGEHGEEGEESGTELKLTESYDQVRNGARLVLAYDETSNSFTGTVENTIDETLQRVRVEVHLSNGKELGPTTPSDLDPGEKRDVELKATSKDFDGWTAHPEVGSSEHGHGGEHGEGNRGEHERDGKEHGEGGE